MALLKLNLNLAQQFADLTLMGYFRSDYSPTKTGGAGADTLLGDDHSNKNDKLYGGAGDDVLLGGEGDDWLEGGAGKDVLNGGSGHDVASYINSPDAVRIHMGTSFPYDADPSNPVEGDSIGDTFIEIEQVNGSLYDDMITGDGNANDLYGYNGNDKLFGSVGADNLFGMEGNDYLEGGPGEDTVEGGAGDDTIMGGTGNDHIYGGAGNDTLYGDGENAYWKGDGDTNYIHGGDGNDTIIGSHRVDYLWGEDGVDKIKGGAGTDFIDGGDGDDVLEGEEGNDTLIGGADQDVLYGGAGNDSLEGGQGNDVLFGGEGVDTYAWSTGNDQYYGDAKALQTADIFQFSVWGDNGDDQVLNFDRTNDILELKGSTKDFNYLTVNHTAEGWLQLDFAGGGSVTFVGNADLATVTSMPHLNILANVKYDDGMA